MPVPVIEEEDKVTLTRKRAELVAALTVPRSAEDRVILQGQLSVINAKIKALNTAEAWAQKVAADRRKVAGLAEAQANTARARARIHGDSSTLEIETETENDDDPGQTEAIDGWIDAVLMRHDVNFVRSATGTLTITSAHVPSNLADTIRLLVTGIYAAARGQDLPDLPKVQKPPKAKKR